MSQARRRRVTARVLPVNPRGEVLLLLGHDPLRPGAPYWLSIGGGVERGETLTQAAIRETREEVGLKVEEEQLLGPIHRGTFPFEVKGESWTASSHFFAMALDDDVDVAFDHHTEDELGFLVDWAWLTPAALEADGRLTNPLLPPILRTAVETVQRTARGADR